MWNSWGILNESIIRFFIDKGGHSGRGAFGSLKVWTIFKTDSIYLSVVYLFVSLNGGQTGNQSNQSQNQPLLRPNMVTQNQSNQSQSHVSQPMTSQSMMSPQRNQQSQRQQMQQQQMQQKQMQQQQAQGYKK